MKKSFLILTVVTLFISGIFVACEKENPEPVAVETSAAIDDPEKQDQSEFLKCFPIQADREREALQIRIKFQNLDDRSSCFEDARRYGTELAIIDYEFDLGYYDDDPDPIRTADESDLAYYEGYYTNEYYEEHCEESKKRL